ncbi:hypothetical protein JCM13210_06210 [Thermaerobacter litoralis]
MIPATTRSAGPVTVLSGKTAIKSLSFTMGPSPYPAVLPPEPCGIAPGRTGGTGAATIAGAAGAAGAAPKYSNSPSP